jgi:ribosome recycling factor
MSADLTQCINNGKDHMEKSIDHLESRITKIRAGRAHAGVLDGLSADAYGASTPINQLGNVSTPDSRTISIQPWDRSLLQAIEKAIMASNTRLNPAE